MQTFYIGTNKKSIDPINPLSFKHGIAAFIIGAAVFLAAALPYTVRNSGVFYLYGDFNEQTIPFLLHIRQALSDGSIPQYDFTAGLGMDFLDAYSFYNLFSPFTLITLLIPQSAVLYAVPFLIALKLGVCCLNAYFYASRFCRNHDYALIAAVLYTFSGYQTANFLFHYVDALAFFPLLLYALEAAVTEKRRGIFGWAAALCAFVNYYIFIMEAIFVIIYFLVRLTDKSFRIGLRDFFCLALETLLGTAAAGIVLIPAVISTLNNPRFGDPYSLGNILQMLVYETPWRYARIIQSMFTVPDIQGYTNIFPDCEGAYPSGSRWSSQAMYLPMFGMSGVIAFVISNREKWQTKLAAVCVIIAFVPILNSIFTLGRTTYYARWMFAPTLIMAVMTALALENGSKGFGIGLAVNGVIVTAIALFSIIFPIEKLTLWKTAAYYSDVQKWVCLGITVIGLILTFAAVFAISRDGTYSKKAAVITVMTAFICMESTILFGMGENKYPDITTTLFLTSPELEETSYGSRVTADEQYENMNLLWGKGSMYLFNSAVNPFIQEFCDVMGLDDVSEIYNFYPAMCISAVKDVVTQQEYSIVFWEQTYNFKEQQGIYNIYENPDFIPMGFCYEYFITRDKFDTLDENVKAALLAKAMITENEDAEKVLQYLEEIPESEICLLSDEEFSEECEKRRNTSADTFTYDSSGFTADITLEESSLVFFAAAYSENFTAYVDGEETDLYRSDIGFMSAAVPSGTHTVRFEYRSKARQAGAAASVIGISGLAVYIIAVLIYRKKQCE